MAEPIRGGKHAAFPVKLDEAVGLAHRQLAQQDLIDQRDDGRVAADAEGEREHGGGGEGRAAPQHAQGIAHVAPPIVEPAPDPGLAHLLPHLQHAAELHSHAAPRLLVAHPGPPQVVDSPIDVILQLPIEVPFQPAAPPGQQVEESGHGLTPLR
jgi:hypothetical protein